MPKSLRTATDNLANDLIEAPFKYQFTPTVTLLSLPPRISSSSRSSPLQRAATHSRAVISSRNACTRSGSKKTR